MFGSRQFNTRQFNHEEMLIPPPVATMVFAGYVPTIPFVHITIDIPVATMTLTAPELVGFGPVTINVPLATMEWQQQGLDLVQILAHYVHKAQYPSNPYLMNRVFVIGTDADANMVFGEATNASAITDYGELLSMHTEPLMTSRADAVNCAANILATARLQVARGSIQVNPNCGMEVWDPIQINDLMGNQVANNYRVSGWTFTFDTTQEEGKYEHQIRLTGV